MGLLRILLALMVIQTHVGPISPFGPVLPLTGFEAVRLFFVISGFYMALILNEKYTGPGSTGLFYRNRYMRLWPIYAFSLLFIAIMGAMNGILITNYYQIPIHEPLANFFSAPLHWQAAWLFSTTTLFGMDLFAWVEPTEHGFRFAPMPGDDPNFSTVYLLNQPMMTVAIELMFYLAAPLIVRNVRRVLAALAIGTIYHLAIRLLDLNTLAWNYWIFLGSIYYFMLGALAYHFNRRGLTYVGFGLILAVAAAILLDKDNRILLIALGLALTLPALFASTTRNKWDRMIGELSYPIYVLHVPVWFYLFKDWPTDIRAAIVAVATVALSIPVYYFIQMPIDRWRQQRVTKGRISPTPPLLEAQSHPESH